MLLFAAHDPGAKNVIRPVYEHALSLGYDAQFIDLAACRSWMDQDQAAEFIKSRHPKSVILGCSSNQGEWPLIQACKGFGIRTGMAVDIGTLTKIDTDLPSIIVRPHPRMPHLEVLELACQPYRFLRFDAEGHVSNRALLATSVFSMSMASTVTLESLVLGTPSAFFQVGWNFKELDRLYRNLVDVVRIRDDVQLRDFVAAVAGKEGAALAGNLEIHHGALGRTWAVIEELMAG